MGHTANYDDAGRLTGPVSAAPLLTRDQEVRLAKLIRAAMHAAPGGSKCQSAGARAEAANRAREQFIQANVRLVWSIARKYRWVEGVEMPELIQEGYTGLIEAVERYDPARGTRFSTCATWWILKAIRRFIDNESRLIRLPVHTLNRVRELRKHVARLRAERGGRQPDLYDLAAVMAADPLEVQFLLGLGKLPQSLDEPLDPEDPRAELMTDTTSASPEDSTERRLLHANLKRALDGLPRFERGIIERRFGLSSRDPETLQSIGRSLGLTRDRVGRIEKLLLQALRESKPLRGCYRELSRPPVGPAAADPVCPGSAP